MTFACCPEIVADHYLLFVSSIINCTCHQLEYQSILTDEHCCWMSLFYNKILYAFLLYLGIITSDGSAKCSRCDEEFSDYEKFEEHSDRKECDKKQGIKCGECDSVLKTRKSLKRHILNKHTQHKYVFYRFLTACKDLITNDNNIVRSQADQATSSEYCINGCCLIKCLSLLM